MKNFLRIAIAVLMSMSLGASLTYLTMHNQIVQVRVPATTIIIDKSIDLKREKIQLAMWEVAMVFGRAGAGCKNASPELGRMVAEVAVNENQEPSLVASTISVESDCNPFATSSRGAVGLMQVMASIHKSNYDFQNKVNLFNERQNVETGTKILASYIKQYGREDGILHYQGTGTGCPTCDGLYTAKILRLADGK